MGQSGTRSQAGRKTQALSSPRSSRSRLPRPWGGNVGIVLLAAPLLLVACAPQHWGYPPSLTAVEPELCISGAFGTQVTVYVAGGQRLGAVTSRGGCVAVPWTVAQAPEVLCIESVVTRGCLSLPRATYSNAPRWELELGPHPRSWRWDVLSLSGGTG